MNAEQLNIIARGILQLTGLSPEEIDLQIKNQNKQKARDILKSQPRQTAPNLPKTPPVKPQAPANLTAEQLYGKGRVARSVNTALNMNPTAGMGPLSRIGAAGTQSLLGLLIDPAGDLISDNVTRPILEALTGTKIPDIKDIKELGPKGAAGKLKGELAADSIPAVVAPTTRKRGMANIPPAEAQPGSPSYVPPAAAPATPTSRLQSGAVTAPAPVRPDYNSMSEMERLKIWATTNRKMIESVGTRQQLKILQEALSGIDGNTDLRQQGQATYNRGSA